MASKKKPSKEKRQIAELIGRLANAEADLRRTQQTIVDQRDKIARLEGVKQAEAEADRLNNTMRDELRYEWLRKHAMFDLDHFNSPDVLANARTSAWRLRIPLTFPGTNHAPNNLDEAVDLVR